MSNATTATPEPTIAQLQLLLQQQSATVTALQQSLDSFFSIINGIVIFFMSAGFAFLEAGAVQSKNALHTLMINFADVGITTLSYWLIGYPFAFGNANPFIGSNYYASYDVPAGSSIYSQWFFQMTFAMTAASIPSGSVVERIEFAPFALFTVFLTGFIYPVVSHWVWNPNGWLAIGLPINNGTLTVSFVDFAGSGVVHVVGGSCALVAALMLGPRKSSRDPVTGKPRAVPYHNLPLMMIGCFILMFGFFCFNGGSQGHVSQAGDGQTTAMAVTNTAISGAAGSVTVLILSRIGYCSNGHWSVIKTMNGFLVGQVAICSGCASVWPYGAFCIGLVAGFVYMTYSKLLSKAGLDDPLEAVSVHWGGGSVGCILTAFFNRNPQLGVLLGGTGYSIAWQLAGVLAIAGFTMACSAVYFGLCILFKVYRVPEIEEERGLDWATSGEVAYPFNAYHEGWITGVDDFGEYLTNEAPKKPKSKHDPAKYDTRNPTFLYGGNGVYGGSGVYGGGVFGNGVGVGVEPQPQPQLQAVQMNSMRSVGPPFGNRALGGRSATAAPSVASENGREPQPYTLYTSASQPIIPRVQVYN